MQNSKIVFSKYACSVTCSVFKSTCSVTCSVFKSTCSVFVKNKTLLVNQVNRL